MQLHFEATKPKRYNAIFIFEQLTAMSSVVQSTVYLHHLNLPKVKLEEELLIIKLQLDTLLQELILLKDFEAREEAIQNRCDSKEVELEEVISKVHTSKVKLDAKQKELTKLSEREKAIQQDFLVLIGENKFQEYLTKVFKKKIKRVTQNDRNSEESSDEESSDDDSDWSDEDSDAEPFDDTGRFSILTRIKPEFMI